MLDFKIWMEETTKAAGIKGNLLDFLKDKLHIHDDEEILSMPLNHIDKAIVTDLLRRGILNGAEDALVSDIKNGNITVGDVANRLGGGHPQLNLPFYEPTHPIR